MTKKNAFLILVVVVLGGLSVYLNRDRFGSPRIQISDRSVAPRGFMLKRQPNATVDTVIFLFNQDLSLKSVRVIALGELETNAAPRALWALTSDSNSIPVRSIIYGLNIRGMKPVVKGVAPEPLQSGLHYRIYIEAGRQHAQHDFTPIPRDS